MFGSTYEETAARPPESWPEQLRRLATFVAAHDGADVGVVRGGELEVGSGVAFLLSMWVAPPFRGQGVGEALIDAVVGWARARGLSMVVLDVGHHNAHAIALYTRKGFEPIDDQGTLDPDKEHRRGLRL